MTLVTSSGDEPRIPMPFYEGFRGGGVVRVPPVRVDNLSGSRLALIGSCIGLLGGFGVSRLIAECWPGMQTSSVPMLTGVTLF